MKYYIIAGERSGDLHASNLIKALKQEDPNAQVRAWGGELSEQAGAEIAMHYEKMAFMGFLEVVQNLNTIRKALQFCKDDILAYKPDVVILVDYAGFNMKVAKFTKSQGIRTYYYISPKIWAWNQGRAHNIKKYVDKMFVILPFEKDFYKKFDYEVDYVGNPINDSVAAFSPNANFRKENGLDERPIIAILPGSRKQEIEQMLHYMVSIVPSFGNYQFVVAAVPNFPKKYYEQFRRNIITIVYDQTYDLLQQAEAALVTSGTATLETALFEVPQVVCYKGSVITYWIARSLIKVRFISLVNLIADKEVVKELIQDDFTPNNLLSELKKILNGSTARTQQLAEYKKIKAIMGQAGASEKTAKLIVKYLRESGAPN